MRIIFICHSIEPIVSPRSFRSTNLIRYFLQSGAEVDLIYFHGDVKKLNKYGKIKPYKLNEVNLKVGNKYLDFILDYFFYYPFGLGLPRLIKQIKIVVQSKKQIGDFKIISIAAPHSIHWSVGIYLILNPNLKYTWVADCGDPFIGLSQKFKRPIYFNWLENVFLRKASSITVPIEAAISSFNANYSDKFFVIPQLFYLDEDKSSLQNSRLNTGPTVLCSYAGTIKTIGRNIEPYLELICQMNCNFTLDIYTSQIDLANELVKKYKNVRNEQVNIRVFALIPRQELLKKLAQSNFLLDIPNTNSNQMPSKLIDYLISGRPILSERNLKDFQVSFMDFISGDFTRQKIDLKLEQFDVKIGGRQFAQLLDGH